MLALPEGLGRPPFQVLRPDPAGQSPVIVEVPHAGLFVDPETLSFVTRGPARCIARDADLFMDVLARPALREGATVLVAEWSRWVCDLNRAPTDLDDRAVAGAPRPPAPRPRGLVWRLSTDGDVLFDDPLPSSELERRLAVFYRPYHAALRGLVEEALARFGFAVVLSTHSMPARAFRPGEPRPDLVPGSQGRSTAAAPVLSGVEACARAAGMSLRHDEPYRGGFVTASYGRPVDGVHAVQLEVGRWLYMDEARCALEPDGARRVSGLLASLAACLSFANEGSARSALRQGAAARVA